MSNEIEEKEEFWVLNFLSSTLKVFAILFVIAGIILSFLYLGEKGSYLEGKDFLLSFIPAIIGGFLALLIMIIVQIINLFLKIEKNTQNKELIALLKNFKEEKVANKDKTISTTSIDDSVSNNKAKYRLENVKYIKCSKCGNHNYVNYLETFTCSECGSDIKNGERFSN